MRRNCTEHELEDCAELAFEDAIRVGGESEGRFVAQYVGERA